MLYNVMSANGRPNYVCGISTSKLPTSMLTNEVILCLVRFGFGRNKLVQLLIRSRNSGGRTGRSLFSIIVMSTQNFVYSVHEGSSNRTADWNGLLELSCGMTACCTNCQCGLYSAT